MQRLGTKPKCERESFCRGRCGVGARGFTVPELLVGLVVAAILTTVAVPVYKSAMNNMRMNSMASAISGAISSARYQAVMTSQPYTFAITAPGNTYVVKNVTTNTAGPPIPLPTALVAINGGAAATYTFTLCPNGTVFGAGGTCTSNTNPIPALALTYQSKETDITVSGVGNVTTKLVH